VCVTRVSTYAAAALGGVVLNSMLDVWHRHGALLAMGGTLIGGSKLFPAYSKASDLGAVGVGMLAAVVPHAFAELPYVGRVSSASLNMAGAIAYAATGWFAPQVLSGISPMPRDSFYVAALISAVEYGNDIGFFDASWVALQSVPRWLGWNVVPLKEGQEKQPV